LHTVQDFYSHSNWVELFGIPRTREDAINVRRGDLVDLSGAPASSLEWFAPLGGLTVRDDILLGGDDWNSLPDGFAIERNGGGRFVPRVVDGLGRVRGRLLVTGMGTGDDECKIPTPRGPDYTGIHHRNLSKDQLDGEEDANVPRPPLSERRLKHMKARALATLQTSYEWCRLVRNAGRTGQDGHILAYWVREGGNPHPPHTPCYSIPSGGPRFNAKITVTIDSVKVLQTGDEIDRSRRPSSNGVRGEPSTDGQPGEIQLAAVLYDDPTDFHRSIHVMNRGGAIKARPGQFVPTTQLPAPISLCVPRRQEVRFALHGWDNDDDSRRPSRVYASEFDNVGDPDDELTGFQATFGHHVTRLVGRRSDSGAELETRFTLSRIDGAC
jgi:hypothetical protein